MRGFTVVELLITIAIIIIVSAIGTISLVGFRAEQDLGSATKLIVSVLRDAQQKSISQESEKQWGVHFENVMNDRDFYATFSGASYSSSTQQEIFYLKSSLEFSDPGSGSSKDVIFSKLTGLPQAATNITLRLTNNPQSAKTVTINNNGKVEY